MTSQLIRIAKELAVEHDEGKYQDGLDLIVQQRNVDRDEADRYLEELIIKCEEMMP